VPRSGIGRDVGSGSRRRLPAVEGRGHHAEELERLAPVGPELVRPIRGHEERIARSDLARLFADLHRAPSPRHEDAVFVRMMVMGGVAPGFHGELPHREGRSTVVAPDEHLHADIGGTVHSDGGSLLGITVSKVHREDRIPSSSSRPISRPGADGRPPIMLPDPRSRIDRAMTTPPARTGDARPALAGPRPDIATHVLGPWETDCYVVAAPGGRRCVIVDAGFDPGAMIEEIRRRELEPEALVLTHAHLDHIAGADAVLDAFGPIPVRIHPAERAWLDDPQLNLSAFVEMNVTVRTSGPVEALEDGAVLDLAGTTWTVRHTPGHSPGGVALVCRPDDDGPPLALVGDTLFRDSIGRHDFPTSDEATLFASIRDRIMTLPDETIVLPGHGPSTTVGREREQNMFRSAFT